MAIKLPSPATVAQKWATRAGQAVNEYKSGIQSAGQDWQNGVDGAQDNWTQGVNQAAAANAYENGVAGKSNKYVDKAINVGAARYPSGVSAATGAYQVGIGKTFTVLGGITLPPRMATGNNQARSTIVDDALHQAKLNGQL